MKAYRFSVNIKLGLIIMAVVLAVLSVAYTSRIIDRLRTREQSIVRLYAKALEQIPKASSRADNPFQQELGQVLRLLEDPDVFASTADQGASLDRLRASVRWAQRMPPASDLSFILDDVLRQIQYVPAIVTDTESGEPVLWHNVNVDSTLVGLSTSDSLRALSRLAAIRNRMADSYPPIPIVLAIGEDFGVYQEVHYGDSALIRQLRVFPFVQLALGSLFVLVGYLGFSYIRRSEQSNLWVGMAKEAAHQLGTPISSLMGWTVLLRESTADDERAQALDEVEKDIERLKRVTNRFSDIGSMPKLEITQLSPVIEETVAYIRRRLPSTADGQVAVDTQIDDVTVPMNTELFAWVIENLLKNALDALEGNAGRIDVVVRREEDRVTIDVSDTGQGIDRRQWKNVFRPGYSTKKRGWGLGLSLAKRIVEDYHGGTLTLLKSRPDYGSTFRIVLPSADVG